MAFGFSVTRASIGFSALALALGPSGLSHAGTIQIDPSGGTVLFEGEVIDQDFLRDSSREIVGVGVIDGNNDYFTILEGQDRVFTTENALVIRSGKNRSTVLTANLGSKTFEFSGALIPQQTTDFNPFGAGFDGVCSGFDGTPLGVCFGLTGGIGGCDDDDIVTVPMIGPDTLATAWDKEGVLVAGATETENLFIMDRTTGELIQASEETVPESAQVRFENGSAVSEAGAFLTLDGNEGRLPDGFSGEGANVSFITGLMDDMVGLFDISTLALLETLIFPGTVDRFLIDNDNNWNALVNGSSIAFSGTLPGGTGVPGTPPVAAVPLPAPFALLLAALIGLGIVGRRKGLAAA